MHSDESERRFRNHPSVIAGHMIWMAIVLVLLYFITFREQVEGRDMLAAAVVAAIMVVTFAWSFFYWKRTFYIFEDYELHVTRVAVFKTDKHIQYTRLASVGVRRDLVNRLFGTSTLVFNVNSSMNAQSAEAKLVLESRKADELRSRLNSMIFEKDMTVQEDRTMQTMIRVSNGDIVLHAILGQPTWQALFGLLMLFYAVAMLLADSSGGFVTALFLFIIGELVPLLSVILKYYNYRIFRVGDTITVDSGLISTTRHSFKINKINSVRIREPLFARLFGKALLEAEVVGMSDENAAAPVLCPLKSKSEVDDLFSRLLPEFGCDTGAGSHQPRRALAPMLVTDSVFTAVMVVACIALIVYSESLIQDADGVLVFAVRATEAFMAVVVPILVFGHSGMAQRYRLFDMGEDTLVFVRGGYDISTEHINYDKIQYVSVVAGPLQRRFGVARCSVYMMSSTGYKRIDSGLFGPEDLEKVGEEVMARIRDGRYDYRRYY